MIIKVGCCGTAGLSLREYARRFRLIEVQSSFYRLPRVETANSWRKSVPNEFEFTMKAFQGITHPADSPTWRRVKKQIEGIDPSEVGMLRKSKFVIESWNRSQEIAIALKAKIIVVQLPPSFEYTEINMGRIKEFLASIETTCKPAIEFRHKSWLSKLDKVRGMVRRYNAIIVTDPLKFDSPEQAIQYHRMHGSNGFTNYKHRYTQDELSMLISKLRGEEVYVLFNNISMKEDAKRLEELLERR